MFNFLLYRLKRLKYFLKFLLGYMKVGFIYVSIIVDVDFCMIELGIFI